MYIERMGWLHTFHMCMSKAWIHGVGIRTRFTYRCNMIWTPHSMCIHLWDRPLHCTLHTCVKEWGWRTTFKTYVYTYLNTHTCPRNGMTTSAIRYLYMHIYTSTGWDVHRLQCTYICACAYIMNRMARTIPYAYIQGMESPLISLYMYIYIYMYEYMRAKRLESPPPCYM